MCRQTVAGAEPTTIQGGDAVRIPQNVVHVGRHACAKPARDETGAEGIAGARGVDDVNVEGRRADFLAIDERQAAARPERCARNRGLEPPRHLPQRRAEVGQAGQLRRERFGCNDDVDVLEQLLGPGPQFLDVDDRAHPGLAGRARRDSRRQRLMIVHKQHASQPDGLDRHIGWSHREAGIPIPDDRPIAGPPVDKHERRVTGCARDAAHEARIDALAFQALDASARGIVFTERPDVLRAPAEPGAADCGACALAAGQVREPLDARLASRHRMGRDDGDDIQAVEAQGHDIEGTVGGGKRGQAHRLTFAFCLSIVRGMLPLTKRQREILDFLNEFIQQHGYAPSLEEIGRRFNLSSLATVHKHLTNLQEKGFIKRAWNRSRSVEMVPNKTGGRAVELPLLGYVAAGSPIEAVVGNETIAVPEDLIGKRETYVLRVKGDSMIDEQIRDGDYVIVEDRRTAENGEMVIAMLNGADVTLKKLYREQGRIRLQPANPSVPPIIAPADQVQVQGVVVGVMRRY